jgi:hypothetical protein
MFTSPMETMHHMQHLHLLMQTDILLLHKVSTDLVHNLHATMEHLPITLAFPFLKQVSLANAAL